jgi:ribonuclease HI
MDPVKYILEKPSLTRRVARWQMILTEYDIRYTSQKAIKGSVLSDYLAEQLIDDYQPMRVDFPDEDIMFLKSKDCEEPFPEEGLDPESKWIMMFDGAVDVNGRGVGAVLITQEGVHMLFCARITFPCTNNEAEYEACILRLEEAVKIQIKSLDVYEDSALVINQTNGKWYIHQPHLVPYRDYTRRLLTFFTTVKLHYIPREENQFADALATLSSMIKVLCWNYVPRIDVSRLDIPAYVFAADAVSDDKSWYHDIKRFLKRQEYPAGASSNDKKTLRRLAGSFFLNSDDTLYKRNFDMVLLRCVDKQEADMLMQEVHEGSFGTHAGGHAMAKKLLRSGYYWLTMEADCCAYARKCHKCQIYADKVHIPPSPLNVMSSPWPFAMWGIDVIGKIEPTASNGHRFILVAIDYFTKWVEAASYANVTKQVVARFLKRDIICRYGVPERIITDNGSNLNNKMMAELCRDFKIEHHNSSPYRPKMNGVVEAANKNIKKIVQKMVVTYKDWHEMLPFALHGYRTSIRTSTGVTPYQLVYGMEAVLPIEVEIPSLRVLMDVKLDEAEWVCSRYNQLSLVEEKRLAAICHGQLYQRRMKRAFDQKVRPREYQVGELVLKIILPPNTDHRRKWTPNNEGPYMVKRVFSGGALMLTSMDGEDFPSPVNSDAVKKYFA